jgi:hypothetical protein
MRPFDLSPRQIFITTTGLAGLVGTLAVWAFLALFPRSHNIEAAVRASFPNLCNEWRDTLAIRPNPTGWFATYDVTCVHGYTDDTTPMLTVNVLVCEARPAMRWPRSWEQFQQMTFSPAHTMAVCP